MSKSLGVGLFVSSIATHLLRARCVASHQRSAAAAAAGASGSVARLSSAKLSSDSSKTASSPSSSPNPRKKNKVLSPPRAEKINTNVYFGINPEDPEENRGQTPMDPPLVRVDPYHWLRDESRKNEKVISHLTAENEYCAAYMERLQPLQDSLYEEMLTHLKETDEELPFPFGPYNYYSRTVQGLPYRIICRKPLAGGDEQVVLDENEVAQGHEYSSVDANEPSPNHEILAYAVDYAGDETYNVLFKNIQDGTLLEDVIEECESSLEWGNDGSVLFYMTMDEEHRPYRVHLHVMGTAQEDDILLFEEKDEMFWLGMSKSQSGRFIIIDAGSKETTEMHVIDLKNASGAEAHIAAAKRPQCVSPRKFGLRYDLEHLQHAATAGSSEEQEQDSLLVISNLNKAKNFALFRVGVAELGDSEKWQSVCPYNPARQLEHVLPFRSHVVIYGREAGKEAIWVLDNNKLDEWQALPFEEECFSVWLGDNYVYDTDKLRLVYSSFLTPKSTLEVDLNSRTHVQLRQQPVPLYDRNLYESRMLSVKARDGTQVPCSLVYRKDSAPNGETPRPTLLYGYGSYGSCSDPTFDFKRISLLDRGVVFVIAHIRGGGEQGRAWYEDEGKYLTKWNTFHDFADCASHLISSGVTSSAQLACVGRSAGGLLMGAIANTYGHLFRTIVADVPFVDVMNTMSDPTIPLTVTEWEEWGNPNEAQYHAYMATYSPYDNVTAQAYPAMLVTAGLHDPRVAYWEPAKWVARLRELKTDANPLLLKTDMSSGHFSASDRYKYIKETAHEFAFILDQINPAA